MSATATATNGKPRKQLSDQLDRLDSIIDCLADRLPEAVAEAARDGTRLAVKDAILEILSNPDLRALIPPAAMLAPPPAVPLAVAETPAEVPARRGLWARARAAITSSADALTRRCRSTATAVRDTARMVAAVVPLKRVAVVGGCVGVAVGVTCYLAPHAVAAVASGVGGAVSAVVAQIGIWFRRSARALAAV